MLVGWPMINMALAITPERRLPVPDPRRRSVLIVSTLVSSLAGFLFGYDTIVISGAIGHLSRYFHLTSQGIGWAAGCALIGCLFGSIVSGGFADRVGLKKALYGCSACFAISSIGVWLSTGFTQFVAFRILGGVGIGAASIVAPMYIAEIAPAAIRGRLVVFYQLGIVAGILAAVYVNLLIEQSGTEAWNLLHGWRLMFAAGALPAVLFAISILFSAESPRWLMKKGKQAAAREVLAQIEGDRASIFEVEAIKNSLSEEEGGLRSLLAGPYRRPLLIGFFLAALSQTSGITSLLSFLPEVFTSAGQKSTDAFFQSVLVGVVNLCMTVVALWLVDRAGRKKLLLAGTALQTFALLTVGYSFAAHRGGKGALFGIMLFVAGHAVGNGAVCWVIISEIFPNKVRGAAMSIATSALWIAAYLMNQFFPSLQEGLGNHGLFFFLSAMAVINFVFVLLLVPETKGCSLEAISHAWSGGAKLQKHGSDSRVGRSQ